MSATGKPSNRLQLHNPDDIAWSLDNQVAIAKRTANDLMRAILMGDSSQKRGVYMGGPAGLDKTGALMFEVRRYTDGVKNQWAAMEPEHYNDFMKRRTDESDPNELSFIRPWVPVKACSPREFFAYMNQTRCAGELLIMDDPTCVNDPMVRQFMLDGLDNEANGRVEYKIEWIKKNLGYTGFSFQGAMFINENRLINKVYHKKKAATDLYGLPLLDRFHVIQIRSDTLEDLEHITQYVAKTAFINTPLRRGLWQFLVRPKQHRNLALLGLGFQGSADEQQEILLDVLGWFLDEFYRIESLSYRTVRTGVEFRVAYPDTWREKLSILYKKI